MMSTPRDMSPTGCPNTVSGGTRLQRYCVCYEPLFDLVGCEAAGPSLVGKASKKTKLFLLSSVDLALRLQLSRCGKLKS